MYIQVYNTTYSNANNVKILQKINLPSHYIIIIINLFDLTE
jgi:hypothetical protein